MNEDLDAIKSAIERTERNIKVNINKIIQLVDLNEDMEEAIQINEEEIKNLKVINNDYEIYLDNLKCKLKKVEIKG